METAEVSGVLLKLEPEKVQCVKFGKVKRIFWLSLSVGLMC